MGKIYAKISSKVSNFLYITGVAAVLICWDVGDPHGIATVVTASELSVDVPRSVGLLSRCIKSTHVSTTIFRNPWVYTRRWLSFWLAAASRPSVHAGRV